MGIVPVSRQPRLDMNQVEDVVNSLMSVIVRSSMTRALEGRVHQHGKFEGSEVSLFEANCLLYLSAHHRVLAPSGQTFA